MRLHYFDRPAPNPDDTVLKQACAEGFVPPGCLLGGQVLTPLLATARDPCATCHGPRERCGGRPKSTVEEEARAGDLAEIRQILVGNTGDDVLDAFLRLGRE